MNRFTFGRVGISCVLAAAALAIAACTPSAPASGFPHGTLVDLSHAYDDRTAFWPTADPFRLKKVAEGMTPGGYYYAANSVSTSEHGGTAARDRDYQANVAFIVVLPMKIAGGSGAPLRAVAIVPE